MTAWAFPFLRPMESRVRTDDWLLADGATRPMPSMLPSWDYLTDLELRREIAVDLEGVLVDCALPPGTPLILAAGWWSDHTWLREIPFRVRLEPGESTVHVGMRVPGQEVGGQVRVRTQLLLGEDVAHAGPLAPHRAGNLLWSDEVSIRVQGDAALFPVSTADFGARNLPPGAGWWLDVRPDASLPMRQALRLLVNESHPAVMQAVSSMPPRAAADQAVFEAIQADVARVMLQHAFVMDIDEGVQFAAGSLGEAFRQLATRLFPAMELSALRELLTGHPNEFSSELQARLQLFKELS